jgi:hypothetical protein
MVTNPFTSAQAGPSVMGGQTLTSPEIIALDRQRKMAEMLLKRSAEGQPSGQMVSGFFVPPSFAQRLNPLLEQALGQRGLKDVDEKTARLAEMLRQRESEDLDKFFELQYGGRPLPAQAGPMPDGSNIPVELSQPDPRAAFEMGMRSSSPIVRSQIAEMLKPQKLSEGERIVTRNPFTGEEQVVAQGAEKFRAPLQVDTGTSIQFLDPKDPTKVLRTIPKSQGGQIYESSEGPLIVNTRTNTATPLLGADGKPLSPKLSSEQQKDIVAINQQKSVIKSALDLVEQNPKAFSFARGAAVALPFGETLAGRTETAPETEARSAVFNIVSKVINERAGAAQSAQELKRLNAFLPSEFDNAKKIQDKLRGFNKYLEEQEKGVRAPTTKTFTPATSNVFASEADAQKAFNEGKLEVGQKITINGVTGTWR